MFLTISTCFLYLVAAGLFSKAVGYFETNAWNKIVGGDASEVGSGPGSYDIRKSVWHVNCCNPEINGGGGWGIFNSVFGWTNSATYGTVISYNLYWVFVMLAFYAMRYNEQHGHWPLLKSKAKVDIDTSDESDAGSDSGRVIEETTTEKKADEAGGHTSTAVRELGL